VTDEYDPNDPAGFDPYGDLSDLTADESLPPMEDPTLPPATPPRSPLLTGLIVALLLAVISIAFFQLLGNDDEPAASATTTTTSATTTTAGGATTSTTTTSDGAGTTTGETAPPASFDPYVASGEAVPPDQLTLAVDSIGPIELGSPAADAVGRLIASLGDPTTDSGPVTSTGTFGACEGETERIVRWGPLVAVVVIDPDGTEIFGGYRLDLNYGDILSSAATDLATVSGLQAGQSVRTLEDIYSDFRIDYVVEPGLDTTFQLFGSSGAKLLWGPVTSEAADGIVTGIYAPDACGRFQ
jgi:hypothetical protein